MRELIDTYLDATVVVDTDSDYSFIGTLLGSDAKYLRLGEVAIYDENQIRVSLEEYLIESVKLGCPTSRREMLVRLNRVISLSRLADIVDPMQDDNAEPGE